MFKHVTIAIAAALVCLPVAAEVYKWVDDDGKTHYSDRPIGDDSTELAIKSQRTDNAAITAARQARVEQAALAAEEEARAEEQAEKDAAARARQEENCRRAREAFASLQNAERLYIPTEDGGRQYLNEEQTQARRDRAAQDVDEWCNG